MTCWKCLEIIKTEYTCPSILLVKVAEAHTGESTIASYIEKYHSKYRVRNCQTFEIRVISLDML